MNQIPNFIIVLDFVHNRIIKIKLSDEEKQFASFCDDLDELVDALSEVYHFSIGNCQWMALDEYKEDSFEFDNNTEANLALSFVHTLSDKEVLDDVISSNDIESVRVCENCGKLMNEGWVYEGIENYSSDTCLKTSHSEIDNNFLKPKSFISVMMITALVFEQMYCRFEGAMGFHCNREATLQMTKRRLVSA